MTKETKDYKILMAESDFEEQVKHLFILYSWMYYHTHRSQFSASGFPDCVMIRMIPVPRLIFAELKTDDLVDSQPTFEQYGWLRALQDLGLPVEAYLWRPSDFDEIVEVAK